MTSYGTENILQPLICSLVVLFIVCECVNPHVHNIHQITDDYHGNQSSLSKYVMLRNMIFEYTITCVIVTLFTSFCNGAYLLRLLKEIHALFIDMFLIDIASIYYPNVVHIM